MAVTSERVPEGGNHEQTTQAGSSSESSSTPPPQLLDTASLNGQVPHNDFDSSSLPDANDFDSLAEVSLDDMLLEGTMTGDLNMEDLEDFADYSAFAQKLRHAPRAVEPLQPVPEQPFPFLRLPLELRQQVYGLYFDANDRLDPDALGGGGGMYNFEFKILRVSKQIYQEARAVWRRDNVFVKLETPWPTAGEDLYHSMWYKLDLNQTVHHISHEGLVPIVAAGRRADKFTQYTGRVLINAPQHDVTVAEYTIILLLDDLPKFTNIWYYSALGHPNLNPLLYLTFSLHDPDFPTDSKPFPLNLQNKLLLPFETVRCLAGTAFVGYDSSVVAKLRHLMEAPYPTVQESCEQAASLTDAGDVLLASPQTVQQAIDAYTSAFDAIHIKIQGRKRRVLADGFFDDMILEGRFANMPGDYVRVVLRLRLVAGMVLAYLRLGRPHDAAFWGMRTIRLVRERIDFDREDWDLHFEGAIDMWHIHARTGTAFAIMESVEGCGQELDLYEQDDVNSSTLWHLATKRMMGKEREAAREKMVSEIEEFGFGKCVEGKGAWAPSGESA